MFSYYAVKYLDGNGYVKSYGYIHAEAGYKPGDIISHMGQTIKIDFKLR